LSVAFGCAVGGVVIEGGLFEVVEIGVVAIELAVGDKLAVACEVGVKGGWTLICGCRFWVIASASRLERLSFFIS